MGIFASPSPGEEGGGKRLERKAVVPNEIFRRVLGNEVSKECVSGFGQFPEGIGHLAKGVYLFCKIEQYSILAFSGFHSSRASAL